MKPILIHIHAFYPELLEELLQIPSHLKGIPYDIWITYPETKPEMATLLTEYEHAIPVPNRGYDIAPFLSVLSHVDLDAYSYVLKLHTKRNMPGDAYIRPNPYNYGFAHWREYLLNVSKAENMRISLQALEHDTKLGMIADYRLIWNRVEKHHVANVKEYLDKAGLNYCGYCYVMGTMFLCRANLLKPLQALRLSPQDFLPPDATHTENLAHTMERFIGASIIAQGYRIEDVFTPACKQTKWVYYLRRLLLFLYLKKRKSDGSCILKICKIPVYSKKAKRL